MTTYVNAFAPLHALYDGYFIHSRIRGSAPLQGDFLQTDHCNYPMWYKSGRTWAPRC